MGDKIISDTIANAGHVEDTREILYRLGINVLDKDGRYRSTYAIINDIHNKYPNLFNKFSLFI